MPGSAPTDLDPADRIAVDPGLARQGRLRKPSQAPRIPDPLSYLVLFNHAASFYWLVCVMTLL
jgi:hypothetical protein